MNSILLTTLSRALIPVLLVFSLYLLLRGHNEPGGGFIGGLVAATAYALCAKGLGMELAKSMLHFDPRSIAMCGVLLAALSGLAGWINGGAYLTGWWPEALPISNVLLFDTGVYLVVLGAVLAFFFALEEAE